LNPAKKTRGMLRNLTYGYDKDVFGDLTVKILARSGDRREQRAMATHPARGGFALRRLYATFFGAP